MKTEMSELSIKALVDWRDTDFMRANPEYQRGEVWTLDQQKKLIDSVFRGYQLPIIYLHKIKLESHGMVQDRVEIIDGQQRINALHRYCKGEFQLYDATDPRAKFPEFLHDSNKHPCPWGGKDYPGLPGELREQLDEKPLPVAFIEDADKNEVRDLFVRLQAGFPLNAQEKRDSMPGEFSDFIMKLGGKPTLVGYPGHAFFTDVLGMKPGSDRGKTRQLAAQIAVLFLEKHEKDLRYFSDLKRKNIDEYYYTQLAFDSTSKNCEQLRKILDKLANLFANWSGPKLVAHNAIHMVLLVDSLLEDYTRQWEGVFQSAQQEFSKFHAETSIKNKNRDLNGIQQEEWQEYGVWTRANSDTGESIERRHRFYTRWMMERLGTNLVPKDPRRNFNQLEREVLYWRDKGVCQVCRLPAEWTASEIHHVVPHKDGGTTTLGNGALVHLTCHPKSEGKTQELAEELRDRKHPGATLVG